MFVCEVPLRSGLTRLIDLQTSKPTAWRVASDDVSIQTYTSSASSQTKPVLQAPSSTGRSWSSATDLNLDNGRDHRAGTAILQAENSARKPGFACITLLSCQHRQSTFSVHESTWFSHRGQTLVVTAFILPHFPHGFSPIDPDLVKKGIIKRCCKYKTAPKTPPVTTVSYTHLPSPRDRTRSRMPSSA